ncbi:MAG: hypothetical protein IAF08_01245 [Rhizobacter sp.]|nr:hypothetical protein [Chlorobiales bacterium]
MNRFALCYFLLCVSSAATAQDKEVQAIRTRYQETAKKVQLLEQDPQNAALYVHRISLNDKGTPWPAVGNYKKTIKFYFELGDEQVHTLVRIDITSESAAHQYATEYLFDAKGQLVFCYDRMPDGQSPENNIEVRYYFSGDKPIRRTEGKTISDKPSPEQQPQAKRLQSDAAELQSLFKAIDK